MTHIPSHPLAARWATSAAETEAALGASMDSGFVHDVSAMVTALVDAQALARMLFEAMGRGFPVDRPVMVAAERLLRAVHATEPALVAREVDRVLAMLDDEEALTDELLPGHAHGATRALYAVIEAGYQRLYQETAA